MQSHVVTTPVGIGEHSHQPLQPSLGDQKAIVGILVHGWQLGGFDDMCLQDRRGTQWWRGLRPGPGCQRCRAVVIWIESRRELCCSKPHNLKPHARRGISHHCIGRRQDRDTKMNCQREMQGIQRA